MSYKKLSDFIQNGAYLLFDFPMYTKIKINMSVRTEDEIEILDYNEDGSPNILNHMHFIENKDVSYLKVLATQDKNFHHYCPFCERSLQIIHKPITVESEYSNPRLTTYTYMGNITEEIELYEKEAREISVKKFKEIINKILDDNNILQLNLECTSNEKHKFHVIFQITEDDYLIKIGQFPSILDFDNSLKEYKKILKNNNVAKELTNAEILKTHNMGVGAFLYLRRIFEGLIMEQFEHVKNKGVIDEHEFNTAKTKDKVDLLHQNKLVPNYLVEINPFIYDILSKGVHQLSEEECNRHYDTLREAILLSLEEKLEMDRKEKLKKSTKNKLNKIHEGLPK